ncbi:hypothetical protein RJT34_16781 [Clitoria ternatea]|uniref:Uncharacterized protein n=1 Tax=Clitoria ternatea TaxID=43366 RepID=A0AAN9JAV5_CLITE
MGGGAWSLLVGGAICLVNSVNERDLSLLNSSERRSYMVWPFLGQTLTPALHVSRNCKVGMGPPVDPETVILQGPPKRIIMNDSRQRISRLLHR